MKVILHLELQPSMSMAVLYSEVSMCLSDGNKLAE